jgi:hypothetical protein
VVAHACSLSYMGGRGWEDHGLNPAWTKFVRPHLNLHLMWWYPSIIPAMQGNTNRRITVQASPGKKWDPISKTTRVTEIVGHLPSKHKALSSNLGTAKENNSKKRQNLVGRLDYTAVSPPRGYWDSIPSSCSIHHEASCLPYYILPHDVLPHHRSRSNGSTWPWNETPQLFSGIVS